MKYEIKEILDRLFVYRNENNEMKYQPEDILTIEDVWLLLDYIINLQEENEKAIEYIKEHIRVDDEYPGYMEMLVEEKNELLNILKGEEK